MKLIDKIIRKFVRGESEKEYRLTRGMNWRELSYLFMGYD